MDRRVVFVGQVSQARMPALLRSADLLVHTALYEPFGMAPLEAMACGTPVMAAAGGAHEDEVVDGATGVLVRPGRPARWPRGSGTCWPPRCCCRATGSPPRTGPGRATPGTGSAGRPWPSTSGRCPVAVSRPACAGDDLAEDGFGVAA